MRWSRSSNGARRRHKDASMGLVGADQWRAMCPQLAMWAAQSAASSCWQQHMGNLVGGLFQSQRRGDSPDPPWHYERQTEPSSGNATLLFNANSDGGPTPPP